MKRGTISRTYGPQGQANVTVGSKAVKIRMIETRVVYEFPLDAVPEVLIKSGFKTGTLLIQLSDDQTRVVSARPYDGKVEVKVKNFGGDGTVPPSPRRDQTPGKKYDKETGEVIGQFPRDFLKFNAIMTIVGEKYRGMEIVGNFVYFDGKRGTGFAPDGEGGTFIAGKNKDAAKLNDFCDCNGIKVLPYSDNVLPPLLEACLANNRTFAVTLDKGWPVTYEPVMQAKKATKRK